MTSGFHQRQAQAERLETGCGRPLRVHQAACESLWGGHGRPAAGASTQTSLKWLCSYPPLGTRA
ncbi:MAG: hypothetical protein IGQ88_12465 [Gloeomargaritaceae cyanobacterium C42_A2020_066]|nr:hypothetical protein [Gloeomargaritaceae cyanobacterium C42_A2020_066]